MAIIIEMQHYFFLFIEMQNISSILAMAIIIEMQHYFFLFLLFLFTTFLLQYTFKKSTNRTTPLPLPLPLPPSPPALPFLGHIHYLTKDIHICFQNLALKYGLLLSLRFGSYKFLLISSSSIATEVYKFHDIAFASRPLSGLGDRLTFGNNGFVFSPHGDYWKYLKKLTMKGALGSRQLERTKKIREEEMAKYLSKILVKANGDQVFNVGDELKKMTTNILGRILMSTRCSEEDNDAEKVVDLVDGSLSLALKIVIASMAGPLRRLGDWIYVKEDEEMKRKADELLDRIWNEHEERAKSKGFDREDSDMMDTVMEAYYNEDAELKLTKNQVKAFLVDVFFAGISASADTTQWTIANLINHLQVMKNVREEIESVAGKSRLVKESDIPNLTYLQAVVKETLRLHPPGPLIPRRNTKACEISGFYIPKDSSVFFNLYAMMRDSKVWENPNEFKPERFLSPSSQSHEEINLNFVAFGGGRRICPGSTLAHILTNIAIASMVQCFDWKVGEDGNGGVDMKSGLGVTLSLSNPLMCFPSIRFNPFSI